MPDEISLDNRNNSPTSNNSYDVIDRGKKRKERETDQVKLRPKRNREELASQRKRLLESTSEEEYRKGQPAWKKTLPDTSSDESMATLHIGIKPGCTTPCKSTPGSAAYDI